MYIILSIDFKLLLGVKNGGILIFFIDTTQCDVATQCDAQNESISKTKKRPLRELCVLASHCVATSHSVAFKKDIILELFYYL